MYSTSYTPAKVNNRPFDGEREFDATQSVSCLSSLKMNNKSMVPMSAKKPSLVTPPHPHMRKSFAFSTPPIFSSIADPPKVSPNFESGEQDGESEKKTFKLKDVVSVQSRTWPGINKPGGMGRIAKINPDNTYNVTYILGGKELNVPVKYISSSSLLWSHTPDRTIKPRDFYHTYQQENLLSAKKKSNRNGSPPKGNIDNSNNQFVEKTDKCSSKIESSNSFSSTSLKRKRTPVKEPESNRPVESVKEKENDAVASNAPVGILKKKKKKKKHDKDKKRNKSKYVDNDERSFKRDRKIKIRIGKEEILSCKSTYSESNKAEVHSSVTSNRISSEVDIVCSKASETREKNLSSSKHRVSVNSVSSESKALPTTNTANDIKKSIPVTKQKHDVSPRKQTPEMILSLRHSKEINDLDMEMQSVIKQELKRCSTVGVSSFVLSCRNARPGYRPCITKSNFSMEANIENRIHKRFEKVRRLMEIRHSTELKMLRNKEMVFVPNAVKCHNYFR